MDDQKKQIIDKLKQANNILVTVKSDPSIDQLAACIGLTLILNELGKHATAVFSGSVPSVLEFLHPEKTLEANTDSLRDFIIALDKSKADKLRYKVEDKVVKIFITPYKTSISDQDLEFSQGDFNVDVVVALGVHIQDELDQAIVEHGKILHDATVMSITTEDGEKLGAVNWLGKDVSSLSEMITSIADGLGKKDILDTQIATALLTGIVAETERFSNNKTTPQTMSASAKLLTAGANQELVASKLAEPAAEPEQAKTDRESDEGENENPSEGDEKPEPKEPPKSSDGTLSIDHSADEAPEQEEVPSPPEQEQEQEPEQQTSEPAEEPAAEPESATDSEPEPHETKSIELPRAEAPKEPPAGLPADEQAALDLLKNRQIQVDEHGSLHPIETEHRDFLGDNERPLLDNTPVSPDPEENPAGAPFDISKFALTPPVMGGTLTANSHPERLDPSTDPLTMGKGAPQILSHEHPGTGQKSKDAAADAEASGVQPEQKSGENAPKPPKAATAKATEAPEPPEAAPKTAAAPAPEKSAPAAKPPEPSAPPEMPSKAEASPASVAPPSPSTETPFETPPPSAEPLIAPAFPMPTPVTPADAGGAKTLEDLEKAVHSPHLAAAETPASGPPASPAVQPDNGASNNPAETSSAVPSSLPAEPASAPLPPVLPADLAASADDAHPALQAALQDSQAVPDDTPPVPDAPSVDMPATPGGDLQAQPLTAAEMAPPPPAPEPPKPATPAQPPTDAPELQAQTLDMPLPPAINVPPASQTPPTSSPNPNPAPAPPVPPPFMPTPPTQ